MFEEFSRGYYLGRLYVEPYDGDRPAMQRDQHERVNEQVYATGDGIDRLDAPLVMKFDNRHLAVHGDESVPSDTLAIPASVLPADERRSLPDDRNVFLAKRDRAMQLLRLQGITAPSGR